MKEESRKVDLPSLIKNSFTKVNKRLDLVAQTVNGFKEKFDKSDKRFNSLVALFFQQIERLDKKMEGYREEVVSFKDDVFTKMDAVYKEVVAMRQEQSVHSFQHEEIDDRLKSLEKTPVVAHDLKAKKK